MDDYLKLVKLQLCDTDNVHPVHVVLGNEACDLDSAASALTYAYFLHHIKSGTSISLIVPLLNIKRQELYLHTDVTYFLKAVGISLDLLLFRDDVDLKALHCAGRLTLTLVDHNQLTPEDSYLASCINEIIDHHPKLDQILRCEIVLELVGSCCTLIGEKLLNASDHPDVLNRQITLLLYGTILLDTICLNDSAKRVTPKDKIVANKLHEFISDVDKHALFKSLHLAKCDVSGLSVDELLRRDLKSVSNDTMKIAISTVSASLKDFLDKPDVEADLEKLAATHCSQIVALMGIQVNPETMAVERQLAVYSAVQGYREQIIDMLEAMSTRGPKLDLHLLSQPYPTIVLYKQNNIAATRKVVLPLLHTFLHGDRSPLVSVEDSLPGATKTAGRTTAINNKTINSKGCIGVDDDQNMASYDPLAAAESEDIVALNDPVVNVASQLHVLGIGDPMSHAGSSQSSNQNSCPYTPQNSCTDGGLELDPYARQILPSFNSREMMEKIESKRGKLRGYDQGDGDGGSGENTFYPFTPKNSFVDGSFEAYIKTVPSFDSGDLLLKVNEKVASMDTPMTSNTTDDSVSSITVEVPQVANNNIRNGQENSSLDKPVSPRCPDAVSFSDKITEKSQDKMDISDTTSASTDKTSPLPNDYLENNVSAAVKTTADIVTTNNDVKENFNEYFTDPLLNTRRYNGADSNTSISSLQADLDLELAANYQTETVDFPDSPRQLKFLTQSTQELSLEETVPEGEEESADQMDDDDFHAILSPSSDGVKLKKEIPRANNDSGQSDDHRMSSSLDSIEVESDSDSFDEEDSVLSLDIEIDDDPFHSIENSLAHCSRRTLISQFSTPQHMDRKHILAEEFSKKMHASMGHLSAILDESNNKVNIGIVARVNASVGHENIRDLYHLRKKLDCILKSYEIHEILANDSLYREYFHEDVLDALALINLSSEKESLCSLEHSNGHIAKSIVSVDRSTLDQSILEHFGEELPVDTVFEGSKSTSRLASRPSTYSDKFDKNGLVLVSARGAGGVEGLFVECSSQNQSKKKLIKVDFKINFDDSISSPEKKDDDASERPNTLTTTGMKKRKIKVNEDILNASEAKEDERSWSSLSNKSDSEILTPVDDMATPDDIDTPDDLDDSVTEVTDPIPEVSAAEERDEERRWRTCVIGGVQRKIDLKVIEPYKKVLSHGGYYGPKRSAIIVFSACYLPDHGRKDYDYVMDNLFLYVLTTLDQLVAEDYVLVYLHGALDRSNMPTFGWLKRCYQMIDRRLRKNLKGLYLVHPTFWLKTIVLMTKPFISTKFSRKLQFVSTLQELAELIPVDQMSIPDRVKQLEFQLMIKEKKRKLKMTEASTPKESSATTVATAVKIESSRSSDDDDSADNHVEGICDLNYRRQQVENLAFAGF